MLIKYKNSQRQVCINFNKVDVFVNFPDKTIRFYFGKEETDLPFESNELRDKAFEKIIEAYRLKRITCELDDKNG